MKKTIQIYNLNFLVSCQNFYPKNNQPAIEIFEENGTPAGKLSICLPDHSFEDNETAISSDLPQLSVIDQLEKIGVAKRTGNVARSGYGIYPIVKLIKPPATERELDITINSSPL